MMASASRRPPTDAPETRRTTSRFVRAASMRISLGWLASYQATASTP